MNLKHAKKMGVLFFSILLAVSSMTGCSGKAGPSEQSASNSNKQTEKEKKNVKLKMFVNLDGNAAVSMKSYSEIAAYKIAMEKTGIEVEFQHPPAGSENEQFNLMIASGELPDIIYWRWPSVSGGPARFLDEKLIMKLTDLVDKNAPDYKKVLQSNPDAFKQVTLDDGSIYFFANLNTDARTRITGGLQMRKDWLDKLGLKAPSTIEQWYDVLKAFKTKDPNGDGKNDEIPFLSQKGGDFRKFALAWGVTDGFYKDNGKVKYGPIEPAFKDFLKEMAKWFKEGLIDQEYLVTDGKMFDNKMLNNQGGAYASGMAGGIGKWMNTMTQKNPKFEVTAVPHPIGPAKKSYTSYTATVEITNEGAVITTKSKFPAEAATFLNFFYSNEGHVARNWGHEGQSYKIESGKKVITELITKNPDKLTMNQAMSKYAFPHMGGCVGVVDFDAREQMMLILPQQKEAQKIWSAEDSSLLLPPMILPSVESARFAGIMNEINTYKDEMINKFIIGKEPIEKFDEFVSKINGMGISDAVKMQQTAFEKYNAK